MGPLPVSVWLLAAGWLTAPALAQDAETSFRVSVDAVPVYVRVQDDRGRPLRGLTIVDFQIFEDGVRQVVRSLQEIDHDIPDNRTSPPGGAMEPAAPGNRRYIVIRLEALQGPRSLQRARQAAKEVVRRLRPSGDLAAISWRDTLSGFTPDRRRLEALIDEIRPTLLALSLSIDKSADPDRQPFPEVRGAGLEDDFEQKFSQTPNLGLLDNALDEVVTLGVRASFESAIGRLKHLRGDKICFFFGPGLGQPRVDDRDKSRYEPERYARLFSDAGFTVFAQDPLGVQTTALSDFQFGPRRDRKKPLERSCGLPKADNLALERVFLRRWAEETGGSAFFGNDLGQGVEQAFKSNDHAYLLTYQSGNETHDAKFRRIEVRLSSRSGRVLHRSGYYATVPDSVDLFRRTVSTALGSPDAFTDFPLELRSRLVSRDSLEIEFSFPFGSVDVEEREVQTDKGEKATRRFQEIHLIAQALGANGDPVGSVQERFTLDLEPERFEQMRRQNATLARTIHLVGKPVALEGVVVVGQNHQISAVRTLLDLD